ncbi:MAG TPA: AsmA family protein [Candidatus Acidoferrales bacterium]|nr:AsmA family protein [Candidatus Acidoferrales bacterium]
MKKALVIVGIVIVVLLVIGAILPFLIDANQFKPTLETDLSSALGRKVAIGNIHLAIFSGGVTIDNVSIADDPGFSSSPFLQAKKLTAGVALLPLIFSKKIDVSSFTVTDPQVALLRMPSGTWNFSSLAASESKTQPKGSSPSNTANFSVQKITISNGTIRVGTTGPGGKTQTYQNVTLKVSDLSLTSQFPFQLAAKTPGNGTVDVDGKAGPINSADASLTPLDAKVDVHNLDLASTGFVDPSSGLAGLFDFSGTLNSDGQQMNSKGTAKADKIKLVPGGSPASVPVNIDYDTAYNLKSQTGSLTQGNVHVGKALAHLDGTYNTAGTETSIQMKLNGQGMPVTDLQGVLPAVGITLPSGSSLQGGTLDANLALSGPVDKLTITGPINLSNGKLAGFDLKSKLGALSSFTGLGGSGGGSGSNTDIQTFSANMRVDPQGTHADNVNLIAPAIGTITGTANINATGQLNCKLIAKLTASSGAAGSVASAIASFTGGGNARSLSIPFTVTGTTSKPIFLPDVGGAVNNLVKGSASGAGSAASSASGILGGFLNRKKSH